MAFTATTTLAADLQTYFASELLVVAEPVMVFKQFANMTPIPANSSKTISFSQYGKLPLVAVGSVLTEGVPPTENSLAVTAITAIADQYGAFVKLTDLAVLTPKHPVVAEAMYLLGRQAGESIDQIISGVILAGTAVQYGGAAASRVALAITDVATSTVLRKAVKALRANAAVPFGAANLGSGSGTDSGSYVLVVDPSVEADLLADTTFVTAASYSAVDKLFNSEIGTWFGVRVVRSNNMVAVASTTTVHTSLLLGKNAFAVADLQNLQMITQEPGSVSDPLEQYRTLGWKVAFKTVILNNNFMIRIETGSAYN